MPNVSSLAKLRRLIDLRRQFLNKRTDLDRCEKEAVAVELSYLAQVVQSTIDQEETTHAGQCTYLQNTAGYPRPR